MMTVGEYTKHGEGMGSFVSYKVNVKVRTSPHLPRYCVLRHDC